MDFILSVWLLFVQRVIGNYLPWEEHFNHFTYIDGDEEYRLYWTIISDEIIEIGLEVNSTGWAAFGISPQGKMTNADIVIGWIDDENNAILQNRYTEDVREEPKLMQQPGNETNIELIDAFRNNTKLYLHFTRLLFPCNDNSVQVPIGTARVIFAWNNNIPTVIGTNNDGQIIYDITPHNDKHRGSQSVNLLQGETNDMEIENASYIDLRMDNFHVPYDTHTTYYCKLFELPHFNETQHIIRIDPLITPGNEGIVHHFSFTSCPKQHVTEDDIGHEEHCDLWANMGANISHCADTPILFGMFELFYVSIIK